MIRHLALDAFRVEATVAHQDLADGQGDVPGTAMAFQNGAAPIRLRLLVGATGGKHATVHHDGAQNLAAGPEPACAEDPDSLDVAPVVPDQYPRTWAVGLEGKATVAELIAIANVRGPV